MHPVWFVDSRMGWPAYRDTGPRLDLGHVETDRGTLRFDRRVLLQRFREVSRGWVKRENGGRGSKERRARRRRGESLRLVTSGYKQPRYHRIGWKVCACRSKKKYYSKLDPSKGVDSTPTRSRRALSRVFPLLALLAAWIRMWILNDDP